MQPALQPLVDEAVAAFARLLETDEQAAVFPNLLDTQQAVADFTAQLGLRMLQAYADVRFKQSKAAPRQCSCGRPMQWHAATDWQHGTRFGNIAVKDAYAYCRSCHSSARPLHGWLGTETERWSLDVEEKVVDLASDESCQRAVDKLKRHHPGVEVSRSTALTMLHRNGEQARQFVADKLAGALARAAQEGKHAGIAELEVEYDGGMIPVATLEPIETPAGKEPELTPVRKLPKRRKNCRWEEAKLGLVQVPGEVQGRLYTVRPTNELDEAFRDLLALACLKDWSEQTEVRGLADGAKHIRPRMEDAFNGGPFRFILDRPHAKEHLAKAGEELEKLGGAPKAEWADAALRRLESGAALEVVNELRLAMPRAATDAAHQTLRLEADYFERNRDAVAYQSYREQGWSTASSEVESGHRSVVQVRLKLPGTWWHPDRVKNILALRMIKANGWWTEYWDRLRQRWRERALEVRSIQPRTKLSFAA